MYFYDEPVFRPPSEANSLIFQATLGCSWNKCAFCEMYSTKKFSVKPQEKLFAEIEQLSAHCPGTRKVFLADGNAMVLSHAKLLAITKKLNQQFPKLGRISAYALPSDMRSKTIEELESLRDQKLNFVYVGIESGDDELLRLINKSETAESTIQGLVHARRAGVRLSVMIILGLGGRKYSKQHAIRSAEVLNAIQPEYFSTLVLSYPFGEKHFQSRVDYEHQSLSTKELLQELHLLIDRTQLEGTIFRSDHASNYLSLKGVLGKDKHELLKTIEYALSNPQVLREEWMRGL